MAIRCALFDFRATKILWTGLGRRDFKVQLKEPTSRFTEGRCRVSDVRCLHSRDSKCRNASQLRSQTIGSARCYLSRFHEHNVSRKIFLRCISTFSRPCFGSRKFIRSVVDISLQRSIQTLSTNVKFPGDRDIENYLKRLKIPFKNGYTSIVATCPTCKSLKMEETERPDNRRWNLFINKTTGKFICKKCGHSGAWNEIKVGPINASQTMIDSKTTQAPCDNKKAESFEQSENILQIFEKGKCFSEASNLERDLVNKRFKTNSIDLETFEMYNVRIAKHEFHHKCGTKSLQTSLAVPLYDITRTNIIALKLLPLEEDLPVQMLPRKHSGSLFGAHCEFKTLDQVVLTASEFDAMAIMQATGLNAVSLPAGTSVLPPEVLPQLESFEKIILWFGNDSRSKQAINQFSRKLDMERCSFVRFLEEGSPSGALDALNKGLNLKSVIAKAKTLKHKEILTFSQLREDVLGEFLNADEAAGVKWKRFPALTSILKGHRRGELSILTGQTGTGKTTLLSELSLDLCAQGVNTLWGSFEIKNVRLLKAMMCQYSGLSLELSISQFNYWADRFDDIPLYFMSYFGAHSVNTVLETMSHAAYVYDIEHIILDNLQFMMSSTSTKFSDRFSAMDYAISALRNFASSANVHVTLVIHPRKENQDSELQTASIFGTAKASQEADNILILQDAPGRLSRRYLQVTKNRYDGAVGKVPLQFNRESLCMSGFYRESRTGNEKFMTSNSQGINLERRDFVEK